MSRSREAQRQHAHRLLRGKLLDLEARGGAALAALVNEPEVEKVAAPDTGTFEVTARAFWDVDPGDSDLYVEVAVSPSGSVLRRSRRSGLVVDPYTGETLRYSNFPVSET